MLFNSSYPTVENKFTEFFNEHWSIISVWCAHIGGILLSFQTVSDWARLFSLSIPMGYGIWRWRVEYLKEKKIRLKEEKEESEKKHGTDILTDKKISTSS